LFSEWDCSTAEVRLFPGDIFVVYTDGITESFSAAGEDFGEARLIGALRRHRELAPEMLMTSIVDEVQKFSTREQHDDVTLIVAKCKRAGD
jgi:serine phosphatase RsbU (regulator of sigma subunit)